MRFLLDTNIGSAHIRRPGGLQARFVQHAWQLAIPTVVLGELYAWAYRREDPESLLRPIQELLADLILLDFDAKAADRYGRAVADLGRRGLTVAPPDLMIAATALAHDLTLVTHNTAHFATIPGLRVEDWLADGPSHRSRPGPRGGPAAD